MRLLIRHRLLGKQPTTCANLRRLDRFARAHSHILFSYGTLDPWARLGLGMSNLSASLPIVAIDGDDGQRGRQVGHPQPEPRPRVERAVAEEDVRVRPRKAVKPTQVGASSWLFTQQPVAYQ